MKSGWIKEPLSFKDYSAEKMFGATGGEVPVAFSHDIKGLPVVYQGSENTCVPCSVTFLEQWFEKTGLALSHEFLAKISKTTPEGATPKQVLQPAKDIGIAPTKIYEKDYSDGFIIASQHKIGGYARLTNLAKDNLASFIHKTPIMVGVDNFKNVGPHMMVAYGYDLSTNVVKCSNWWDPKKQDLVDISFDEISYAAKVYDDKDTTKQTMKILDVLKDKALHILTNKLPQIKRSWFALIVAGFLATVGVFGYGQVQKFGAGYTPVTAYQSRTTQYINASASTIPVASTKDKAGNQIDLANISSSSTVRVYMNIEGGRAREELIYCTGVTATTWTGCVRGLAFQGGDLAASSTLATAHNAGSSIIITNVGQFYGEYVSLDGAQNIYGVKTFYSFPVKTDATTLPTADGQLATKYYVDNVGAGGFTSANVSTTRGLSVDGSAPERVGINLLTGGGLTFIGGALAISSSTSITISDLIATTTADQLQITTDADSANDVMNRSATDARITDSAATGTAKLAITAGKALWVSSTSTLAHTDTSAASSTYQFVGIALSDASIGEEIRYTRPGGVNCNQTGLVPGMSYYLNGTDGQISTTAGTYNAKIGRALSSTCILVIDPKFVRSGVTAQITSTGDTTVTTGFYPARIELIAKTASVGYSYGTDANVSFSNRSLGEGSTSNAWYLYQDVSNRSYGTVSAKSATDFTLNTAALNGAGYYTTIYWTAYSE